MLRSYFVCLIVSVRALAQTPVKPVGINDVRPGMTKELVEAGLGLTNRQLIK
jgi:hypothetical protein